MSGTWPDEVGQAAEVHLERLAKRLKVKVYARPAGGTFEAHVGTRQVWVPEMNRPLHYLIALHEIGHIASKVAGDWSDSSDQGAIVLTEGAAWAWAMRAADPSIAAWLAGEDWTELASLWLSYMRIAATSPTPRRGQALI